MTSTTTQVMQGIKRVDSSRKQQIRLPIIAPKDDQSASTSSSRSLDANISNSSVPPRARLPPRSRSGCWTCRTRKVKCDEGRPLCGQCTRLGHNCDYSPRLSFRDDTPRVVERMQDVSIIGSSVWDTTSPGLTEASPGSAIADDLPPFTALMTDEERERKAESSSPGTYNVVVNPDSFQHLPEYSEDYEARGTRLSPLRQESMAVSMVSSQGSKNLPEGIQRKLSDPDIVILPRFEDSSRRPANHWREPGSPTLVLRPQTSQSETADLDGHMDSHANAPLDAHTHVDDGQLSGYVEQDLVRHNQLDLKRSLIYQAATGGKDWNLLQQFRNVVWRQLAQVDIDDPEFTQINGLDSNVLESTAAFFPPLFHAMMAVAALSLAHQEGKERLDALQHYQQALQNNLRSADDISSDGAFLTHFLLLVYEIAAAETGGSNLWSQHLNQLLRISLLRREVFGGERFPFITWWICNIDMYALFSGAGSGDYVGTMLKNDMMPPPSFHLCPLGIDGSSIIFPEETNSLPAILQLNYEVTLLAVRLGLLAQELRQEELYNRQEIGFEPKHVHVKIRQSRVLELQESLRQLWIVPNIMMIAQCPDFLPRRSRELLAHTLSLYRAGLVFSHTSMWPSQRLDTGPESDAEIALSISEILHIAEDIVRSGKLELRFIVFPLFMAGFASTDGGQRMQVLDLLEHMEKTSIGSNTTATRHALQIVYKQQQDSFMHTGHSLDVCWAQTMVEQGLQVVNFGL